MRSVRVLRNIATNYLRFFAGGAISFLLTPVMVHLLGDGEYGLWVTVFSLTGYFGLVDQGIRPSLVRYVSRHKAAGDDSGLARTLNSAIALYSGAGVLSLAVTAVVAANFGHWFRIDPAMLPAARGAVALAGLSLALGFPLGVFGATLSGLQRYDLANLIGIGIAILRAIVFIVILRTGGGIVELAWGSLAANLVGHLITFLTVRRLLPALPYGRRWVDAATLRQIGAYSGFAFVGALATSIAFQTDSLVITAFIGAAAVTPFALRTLVYSATWVLAPTASEMETLGETEPLQAMLIGGARYSVLLSWPVLAALVIFGGGLLSTWVGEKYREAALLLTALAVPTLLSLPQSAASSMLYGISRHKGMVTLSLLNALLNLGLSLLWVKPWGLLGVALGTAVPLALVGGVATAVYAARAMKLSVRRYLWEGMGQPALVCLAFIVPALAIERLWNPVGWVPLGASVGGCWLLFAAAAWRWGVGPAERHRWSEALPRAFGLQRRAAVTEARP
jgi:O-antigen/teichoic acid export membrane protein